MKFVLGGKYKWWYEGSIWIYDGQCESGICDDCRKSRQVLHRFHEQEHPRIITKLGSECVKEMKEQK